MLDILLAKWHRKEEASHCSQALCVCVSSSSLQMELLFAGQSHLKAIWLQEMDLVFLYISIRGDLFGRRLYKMLGKNSSLHTDTILFYSMHIIYVPLTSNRILDLLYSLTISYSFEIVSCSLFNDRLCDFVRDLVRIRVVRFFFHSNSGVNWISVD